MRFDESLAAFVAALLPILNKETLETGWIIRDASGRLAFIADKALSADERSQAAIAVKTSLGEYCRESGCVFDNEQPGIQSVIESARVFTETINNVAVRLIDRRIVGQDWLIEPAPGWQPPAPARWVFASLKGGVGRSTALAVAATELARQGRKVLAVDLDLEAPGLGTLLIEESDKPKYGVLDWYVEQGIGSIPEEENNEFLGDMVAPSPFGRGKGLIDVVPAIGRISDDYPGNVLAKLARAYLDLPQEVGQSLGFLDRTQKLIDELASRRQYDAVLVDARAGLNESTAAAILGLGADVLLFGVDTPQTFAGYRYLLAHLKKFIKPDDDDWWLRLRMVHAKASPDERRKQGFRDKAYRIFSESLYQDRPILDNDDNPLLSGISEPIYTQMFDVDSREAPHYAWPILDDSNYAEFDPLAERVQMDEGFYGRTFAGLVEGIGELIEFRENTSE
ncbi:CobQ/CobB/MinD/ParA nucleotide binding domain-containing protein [Methylomagnum ishizawai]|uniref:CobQ/CobB/MinD/ParA nucleotide binding domain-containing protein n=1 Tax=Methylomagnum ishizawai TaxID=1760988 RepID=A0A1Y6CS55_9GAMM|nr:hypothetical protein [Methylomagnum ishizawai]SMF93458.1 CobQ/CobB/MinD/ParA nucleotide binding domain-containing protein [Methylomagnum ishizawai]